MRWYAVCPRSRSRRTCRSEPDEVGLEPEAPAGSCGWRRAVCAGVDAEARVADHADVGRERRARAVGNVAGDGAGLPLAKHDGRRGGKDRDPAMRERVIWLVDDVSGPMRSSELGFRAGRRRPKLRPLDTRQRHVDHTGCITSTSLSLRKIVTPNPPIVTTAPMHDWAHATIPSIGLGPKKVPAPQVCGTGNNRTVEDRDRSNYRKPIPMGVDFTGGHRHARHRRHRRARRCCVRHRRTNGHRPTHGRHHRRHPGAHHRRPRERLPRAPMFSGADSTRAQPRRRAHRCRLPHAHPVRPRNGSRRRCSPTGTRSAIADPRAVIPTLGSTDHELPRARPRHWASAARDGTLSTRPRCSPARHGTLPRRSRRARSSGARQPRSPPHHGSPRTPRRGHGTRSARRPRMNGREGTGGPHLRREPPLEQLK